MRRAEKKVARSATYCSVHRIITKNASENFKLKIHKNVHLTFSSVQGSKIRELLLPVTKKVYDCMKKQIFKSERVPVKTLKKCVRSKRYFVHKAQALRKKSLRFSEEKRHKSTCSSPTYLEIVFEAANQLNRICFYKII